MPLQSHGPDSVGGRIKYMRETRGMTQPALAKAIGVSQPSISSIESGSTHSPTAANLLKIAAVLGANPTWLITGEGSPDLSSADADEAAWLSVYRQLDEPQRRAILAAAKAIHGTKDA